MILLFEVKGEFEDGNNKLMTPDKFVDFCQRIANEQPSILYDNFKVQHFEIFLKFAIEKNDLIEKEDKEED